MLIDPSTDNLTIVYPQNPVFSVNAGSHSKNDDTASPGRDADSPSGTTGGRSVFRNKTIRNSHKSNDYQSDSDRTRSASPVAQSSSKQRIDALLNDEGTTPTPRKGPGRGNWRRNRTTINDSGELLANPRSNPKGGHELNSMTTVFVPVNGADSVGAAAPTSKRSRPLTSHQIALEKFRKDRVNHILDRGLRKDRERADRKRKKEGSGARAWKRIRNLPDRYDSEEEASTTGAGRVGAAHIGGVGITGFRQNEWEDMDYGAEAAMMAVAFRRMRRRLERHEDGDAAVNMARNRMKARAKRHRERDGVDEEVEEMDVDGGENEHDGDNEHEGDQEDVTMEGHSMAGAVGGEEQWSEDE